MNNYHIVDKNIRRILKNKGIEYTNVYLANLIDVSEGSVRNWLLNKTQPNLQNIKEIAEALGVEMNELFSKKITKVKQPPPDDPIQSMTRWMQRIERRLDDLERQSKKDNT